MADVARYGLTSQRVGAADFGVHRLRGLEEAGAYGLSTMRALDGIANQQINEWQRELTKEGAKEGSVVVRNEDGSLGQIRVEDDSSSYGAAFMAAQKAAYGAALAVDARTSFSKLHQAAIAPVDADGKPLPPPEKPLDVFREGSRAYIAKTVEAMPPDVRSRAMTELTGIAAQHELALTDSVRKIELGQQLGKLRDAAEVSIRESISSLRNGDKVTAEVRLKQYHDLVDHMATLDRATFTPDVVREAKEAADRSIEAVSFEKDAMGAFRKSYSRGMADRGEAASIEYIQGRRAELVAKFGEAGAEKIIDRVQRMVNIQSRIMTLRDNANERAAQEAYAAALPELSDKLNRALAGNGRSPLEVQAEIRADIAKRFGARYAAEFEGRSLPSLVPFREDVRQATNIDDNWMKNIREMVANGSIKADDLWTRLQQMHDAGEFAHVSPKMESQLFGVAEQAKMAEIRRDQALRAAQGKLSDEEIQRQKLVDAYNHIRTAAAGGAGIAADSNVAKAADMVIESEGYDYASDAGGAQIANLFMYGRGVSPDARHRIQSLVDNPTVAAMRAHAGFLRSFMGSRDAEDVMLANLDDPTRQQLTRMWGSYRQFESEVANAKDPRDVQEAQLRLEKKIADDRRLRADAPKSLEELRRRDGDSFRKHSDEGVRAAVVEASHGGLTLGRLYSARPGEVLAGSAVLGNADALLASTNLGDINSLAWSKLLNQIPGAALSTGVEGLAMLLGGEPEKWSRNVASLPVLGSMLYSWRKVDIEGAERYDLRQAVETEAARNGGNWKLAGETVGRRFFTENGYGPTLYHEGNWFKTRAGQDPTAKIVPYPIDEGPGGADVVRPMLYQVADKMLKDGVRIPGVTSAWEAMHRSDLFSINYAGHRVDEAGRSRPTYSINVRVGEKGESWMRVGGAHGVFFRPELSADRYAKLERESQDMAVEIVRKMRLDRSADLEKGGRVAQPWIFEAYDTVRRQFGDQGPGPIQLSAPGAALTEKLIAGTLMRGALFKELAGRTTERMVLPLIPGQSESGVRERILPPAR